MDFKQLMKTLHCDNENIFWTKYFDVKDNFIKTQSIKAKDTTILNFE